MESIKHIKELAAFQIDLVVNYVYTEHKNLDRLAENGLPFEYLNRTYTIIHSEIVVPESDDITVLQKRYVLQQCRRSEELQ